MTTFLLFGWAPGAFEIVIIGVVVLLLFGNRLPSVMRSLGRGVIEFKKGVQGVDDEDDDGTTTDRLDKPSDAK